MKPVTQLQLYPILEPPCEQTGRWPYRFREGARRGEACRLLKRGADSVLVEFEDGSQVVTSRFAVRGFDG